MRILQVISHYVPAYAFGGPLQMAHGLSRALIARGHEVTVCCTNLQDTTRELDVPLDQPVVVDGVRVFYESIPFARYWGYSPGMRRRLAREAPGHDVVFTHFHYQYATIAGASAARKADRPYVVFAHGSLNRHGISARNSILKRLYLGTVERRNMRGAGFVAYQSAEEIAQSFQFGRSEVVPIGVALEPVGAGVAQRRPGVVAPLTLVYLGRLAKGKGLDLLLVALGRLKATHDMRLVLIGGDEHGYEAWLRARVQELGLSAHVTFTGLLTGTAKRERLAAADIFVLPSRSEGLSLATLEAMALGLPVIVSNRVGVSPKVEQYRTGLVCDYEVDSLTEILRRMAGRDDRREMGERGRRYVEAHHSWDRVAGDLLDKLSRMAPAAGSPPAGGKA